MYVCMYVCMYASSKEGWSAALCPANSGNSFPLGWLRQACGFETIRRVKYWLTRGVNQYINNGPRSISTVD